MTSGPTLHAANGPSAGRLPLWFGLFGASLAWSLQELVGYGLAAGSCALAAEAGEPRLSGALLASVVLTLVGAAALLVAIGAVRRSDRPRGRFMALGGVLVSALFLAALLANLAILFLVPVCGPSAG